MAALPLTDCAASLCLYFLVSKMGAIIAPTAQWYRWAMKIIHVKYQALHEMHHGIIVDKPLLYLGKSVRPEMLKRIVTLFLSHIHNPQK